MNRINFLERSQYEGGKYRVGKPKGVPEYANLREVQIFQRIGKRVPFYILLSLSIETRPFFIATTTAWVRALALSFRNMEVM